MAFKNYTLTTSGSGTQQVLCTAGSSTDIAIVSVQVYGGPIGGSVQFVKKKGAVQMFRFKLSVQAQQTVAMDHKIFVPAGYTYSAMSTSSGIRVCANAMQLQI